MFWDLFLQGFAMAVGAMVATFSIFVALFLVGLWAYLWLKSK